MRLEGMSEHQRVENLSSVWCTAVNGMGREDLGQNLCLSSQVKATRLGGNSSEIGSFFCIY